MILLKGPHLPLLLLVTNLHDARRFPYKANLKLLVFGEGLYLVLLVSHFQKKFVSIENVFNMLKQIITHNKKVMVQTF